VGEEKEQRKRQVFCLRFFKKIFKKEVVGYEERCKGFSC